MTESFKGFKGFFPEMYSNDYNVKSKKKKKKAWEINRKRRIDI